MAGEPDAHDEALPTVASTIELRDSMVLTIIEQQHRVLRTVRRWFVGGFVVMVLFLCAVFGGVYLIRETQQANQPTQLCQTKGINGLLKDVPLAFSGDKNARDYSPVPTHCPKP